MKNLTLDERIKGCIYGHIVCDIIGSFNEFTSPPSTQLPSHMFKSNWRRVDTTLLRTNRSVFGYPYGAYTDDTSMSLAAMDEYATYEFSMDSLMSRFLDWKSNGR